MSYNLYRFMDGSSPKNSIMPLLLSMLNSFFYIDWCRYNFEIIKNFGISIFYVSQQKKSSKWRTLFYPNRTKVEPPPCLSAGKSAGCPHHEGREGVINTIIKILEKCKYFWEMYEEYKKRE